MRTETAAVLPFPQRRTEPGEGVGRANVRLEVSRRGRLVLMMIAFVLGLLVAAAALLAFDVPFALADSEDEQQVTVTVEAGDTLWGYAEQYAPEGMSPHEFVTEARNLNHLSTGRITAGQQIELPAAEGAAH
ncbi:LysM peptidoglycan-binding domain-containing protein [Brachybacterium sp. GCM10030268]|uniref:cell division suppressor protein YneA n=1 Tax=Brachybacterium sp. GCM10030268 TaxID=3273382 RepID=UPI003622BAD8